jgi:hypothetical protein
MHCDHLDRLNDCCACQHDRKIFPTVVMNSDSILTCAVIRHKQHVRAAMAHLMPEKDMPGARKSFKSLKLKVAKHSAKLHRQSEFGWHH